MSGFERYTPSNLDGSTRRVADGPSAVLAAPTTLASRINYFFRDAVHIPGAGTWAGMRHGRKV